MYPDNQIISEERMKKMFENSSLSAHLNSLIREAYFNGRSDLWKEIEEFSKNIKQMSKDKEKTNGEA